MVLKTLLKNTFSVLLIFLPKTKKYTLIFIIFISLLIAPATCITLKKPCRKSRKGNGEEWEMGNGSQYAR